MEPFDAAWFILKTLGWICLFVVIFHIGILIISELSKLLFKLLGDYLDNAILWAVFGGVAMIVFLLIRING